MTRLALLFLTYLWHMTVQATVVFALAFLVATLARRLAASFRHLVWAVCLLSLPFLPLISRVVPDRLPDGLVPVTTPVSALAAPVLVLPAPTAPPLSERPSADAGAISVPVTAAPAVSAPTVSLSSPKPPLAAAPASWMLTPGRLLRIAFPDWPLFAAGFWLIGALGSLCRLAAGLSGIRNLQRSSLLVVDGPIAEAAALLPCAHLGTVRQASSDAARVPMTWGALRPVILLPRDADAWPEDRLRAALLHESAHVSRRDWLTQTLIQCVCALLWFHPGVWAAARACRAESERACDDSVLTAGVAAPDYARHLLDVARGASSHRFTGAVAMAQTTRIELRLRAVLDARRDRRPLTRTSAFCAIAASALLLGIGSAAHLAVPALADTTMTTTPSPEATSALNPAVRVSDAIPSVTLPNGVRVRLTGVNDYAHAVRVSPWRSADGSPRAHPLIEHIGPVAIPFFLPAKGGEQGHMFVVQWDYDETKLPTTAWAGKPNFPGLVNPVAKSWDIYYLNPTCRYRIDPPDVKDYPKIIRAQEPLMRNGDDPVNGRNSFWLTTDWRRTGTQVTETSDAASIFRMNEKTCTAKFGVAFQIARKTPCRKALGKTIVSDPAGPVTFTLALRPHLPPKAPAWQHGQAQLKATDYFPYEDERSVLVVDADGRVIYYLLGAVVSYREDSGRLRTEFTGYLPPPTVARAKRFELIDRPYQWASFPKVRLNPNAASPAPSPAQSPERSATGDRGVLSSRDDPRPPDGETQAAQTESPRSTETFSLKCTGFRQMPGALQKLCFFNGKLRYDLRAQPQVRWAGTREDAFYGRIGLLDEAKSIYFCAPSVAGSFDGDGKPFIDTGLFDGDLLYGYVRAARASPASPVMTTHYATIWQRLPSSATSASVTYGVADGPFQAIACAKMLGRTAVNTPKGPVAFELDSHPKMLGTQSGAHSALQSAVELQVTDDFPADDQRQVFAFNSAGRALCCIPGERVAGPAKTSGESTRQTYLVPAALLPRVAQFQLWHRPYTWQTQRLTLTPPPAARPLPLQDANIRISFPSGPVSKVLAEQVIYDAKVKVTTYHDAEVTLVDRGKVIGTARCKMACYGPGFENEWRLYDAVVTPAAGQTFHAQDYSPDLRQVGGSTCIEFP